MDRDRQTRVEQLFAQARELPIERRAAFLDEHCGDDAEVRAEVESLLEHLTKGFMQSREHLPDRDALVAPERIGPYKIERVIGQGGMGVVYLARQTEPVRRTVALKLIKPGMDTQQIIARFATERQALALMNHPNIARVFDAGVTDHGRPYFVMEHVAGTSIVDYCDQHRLVTEERLRLFIEVCRGIQHAHQKGVIHRDIKASNVLVTKQDGRPTPKIIDFGVAKATDHRLTAQTLFTELGQIVGTPEYMSPEQAELTEQDIDTRTDVYSLGVLLYQLLVGAFPFDSTKLRQAGFDELRRWIREEEPLTPSTRFSKLGSEQVEVSKQRRSDPSTFVRQIRGDLDWITMRALEKDRTRRYASASELAADIQRHLDQEPVIARPPSTLYRLERFVRRHRVGVAAAAAVLLALVIGIVGTSVGLVRAKRAEQAAEGVAAYMVDVFKAADPDLPRETVEAPREILDGATNILDQLADQPEAQARFMYAIGKSYEGLGAYDKALELLDGSLRLRRELYGDDDDRVVQALNELGILAARTDRFDQAVRYYEQSLPIAERKYGAEHADVAAILKNLGDALTRLAQRAPPTQRAEQLNRAKGLHERVLGIRQQLFGEESPQVAISLTGLANVLVEMEQFDEALQLHQQSVEIREATLGPDHRSTFYGYYFLGTASFAAERYAAAGSQFARAVEILEGLYDDPAHPELVDTLFRLAQATLRDQRAEAAVTIYDRAIARLHEGGLDTSLEMANSLGDYERWLRARGDEARADEVLALARTD